MIDHTSSRHDRLAVLRQRDFLCFSIARFLSGAGQTLLQAALLWHVYALTGSAWHLGWLGLVRFAPQLMASLYAGAIADMYDRRRIVMFAQCVPALCSASLFVATISGNASMPLIYGLVVLIALGNAFEAPARQALLSSVVSEALLPSAITLTSTVQSLAFVVGPAVGGMLIAYAGGVHAAYAAHAVLVLIALVSIFVLRPRPVSLPPRAISWETMKEGLLFVRSRQPLLGSMTLDMFAVIFGGAQAMLPVYANDILHVGSQGYGLLTAALPAGALLISVVMVTMPTVERTGRVLLYSIAAFGLATMVFGLSRWFPLSLAAYFAAGAADQVSVVMRQTTIQLATPDHLRGRVTAVGQIFIGSSNQLGAVESGFVAAATSAMFAVVSGGAGCLAVVALVAAKMPELRRDTIHPVMDGARRDNEVREAAEAGNSTGS